MNPERELRTIVIATPQPLAANTGNSRNTAINEAETEGCAPSSADTVSVEAVSRMIDSLAPTMASHAQMQAALRALSGEGGR